MVWPSIKGSLREPDVKGTSAMSRAKTVPPTSGTPQVASTTTISSGPLRAGITTHHQSDFEHRYTQVSHCGHLAARASHGEGAALGSQCEYLGRRQKTDSSLVHVKLTLFTEHSELRTFGR